MQVQLQCLWMGNQILQSCSSNLQLNFIFETTNEIWQQLYNTFCLKYKLKSWQKNCTFQAGSCRHCTCAVLRVHLRTITISKATGASNSSCNDPTTLPIGNRLFYLEGGTYSAILRVACSPIHSNRTEVHCNFAFQVNISWFKNVWISKTKQKYSWKKSFLQCIDLKVERQTSNTLALCFACASTTSIVFRKCTNLVSSYHFNAMQNLSVSHESEMI